jgi:hypothetical protein
MTDTGKVRVDLSGAPQAMLAMLYGKAVDAARHVPRIREDERSARHVKHAKP